MSDKPDRSGRLVIPEDLLKESCIDGIKELAIMFADDYLLYLLPFSERHSGDFIAKRLLDDKNRICLPTSVRYDNAVSYLPMLRNDRIYIKIIH